MVLDIIPTPNYFLFKICAREPETSAILQRIRRSPFMRPPGINNQMNYYLLIRTKQVLMTCGKTWGSQITHTMNSSNVIDRGNSERMINVHDGPSRNAVRAAVILNSCRFGYETRQRGRRRLGSSSRYITQRIHDLAEYIADGWTEEQ